MVEILILKSKQDYRKQKLKKEHYKITYKYKEGRGERRK